MSDEPRRSYTGREIVLELFPATPDRLIPKASANSIWELMPVAANTLFIKSSKRSGMDTS